MNDNEKDYAEFLQATTEAVRTALQAVVCKDTFSYEFVANTLRALADEFEKRQTGAIR